MALRRLVFLEATERRPEEFAATDEISIGKASFAGVGGIALDGNANLASDFADPVSPQDLATKAYVDAGNGVLANTLTAGAAIAAGDPVRWSTTNDEVIKALANSTLPAAHVIGVAENAAAGSGDPVRVVTAGPCLGVLTGATVNTMYFLASAGGLTATTPSAGDRIVQAGWAMNATDLWVAIDIIGKSTV